MTRQEINKQTLSIMSRANEVLSDMSFIQLLTVLGVIGSREYYNEVSEDTLEQVRFSLKKIENIRDVS